MTIPSKRILLLLLGSTITLVEERDDLEAIELRHSPRLQPEANRRRGLSERGRPLLSQSIADCSASAPAAMLGRCVSD
jgi:hypothetical protein